jgi:hypothetical protein
MGAQDEEQNPRPVQRQGYGAFHPHPPCPTAILESQGQNPPQGAPPMTARYEALR